MTTMAAIDRVVHHSVILDFMPVQSYRAKEAHSESNESREQKEQKPTPPGSTATRR